ncbi:hypothetical protein [Deinococcus sp.]|uniref:hypothetical protein n=1 Tax=Deinococcus sp. TaxID=47478 RepID=UPI003B5A2D54
MNAPGVRPESAPQRAAGNAPRAVSAAEVASAAPSLAEQIAAELSLTAKPLVVGRHHSSGRHRKRASTPIAQLSRQLDDACIRALHPQELAAILESEGFSDTLVREVYGDRDVFACAERLFRMVPYRPVALHNSPRTAPAPAWRDLLRGVLYLLPALWTPPMLSLWNAGQGSGQAAIGQLPGATLGLLIATLFGWGWMQGVAYLGYVGLGQNQAAAAKMLRRASVAALLLSLGVATGIAAWQQQSPWPVLGITLAISTYLASATTLLVLGREKTLLLAALPAVLWVLLRLAWPTLASVDAPVQAAVLLLLAVGLPLLAALRATSAESTLAGFTLFGPNGWRTWRWKANTSFDPASLVPESLIARRSLTSLADSLQNRADALWQSLNRGRLALGQAGPHALYGWLCAAFLSLALLRPFSGAADSGQAAGLWAWSVVPLVLGMGLLELCLRRLHIALRRTTHSSTSISVIVGRGSWQTVVHTAAYAAGLASLYALALWLAPEVGLLRPATALIAGHLGLGLGLMLSGLLINFGRLHSVLVTWGAAVVGQLLLVRLNLDAGSAYALSSAAALTALIVLTTLAVRDIRNLA